MKKKSLLDLKRLELTEFRTIPKRSIILFADQIRSGHNIGSLFRIADSFLLESILLSEYCVKPPHPEIEKAAIGSTNSVTWLSVPNSIECLIELQQQGYQLIGIEQTDQSFSLDQFKVDLNAKYILIFGNEINGINQNILDRVDACIEIPQFGTKHSLNVSVAAGIVVWHFIAPSLLK
ncbi:MAG: TrmH family RNA methyltransferase [Saprospiraceae bacterium]|nr:TrmH family RNA methyltransferase [Saprospiraceae bacterium]